MRIRFLEADNKGAALDLPAKRVRMETLFMKNQKEDAQALLKEILDQDLKMHRASEILEKFPYETQKKFVIAMTGESFEPNNPFLNFINSPEVTKKKTISKFDDETLTNVYNTVFNNPDAAIDNQYIQFKDNSRVLPLILSPLTYGFKAVGINNQNERDALIAADYDLCKNYPDHRYKMIDRFYKTQSVKAALEEYNRIRNTSSGQKSSNNKEEPKNQKDVNFEREITAELAKKSRTSKDTIRKLISSNQQAFNDRVRNVLKSGDDSFNDSLVDFVRSLYT